MADIRWQLSRMRRLYVKHHSKSPSAIVLTFDVICKSATNVTLPCSQQKAAFAATRLLLHIYCKRHTKLSRVVLPTLGTIRKQSHHRGPSPQCSGLLTNLLQPFAFLTQTVRPVSRASRKSKPSFRNKQDTPLFLHAMRASSRPRSSRQ